MTPTVSIIMPCFNAEMHLEKSMGSVLSQTYADWELIVVDDGSTDGTLAWLQTLNDQRIQIRSQANQGVSSARNTGLANASGRYVAFLDADDTWNPQFLAKMVASLKANPDAVLAYCGWQNVGLSSAQGKPFVPPDYEDVQKAEFLLADCPWPIHAALVKRDAVIAAGGFDRKLRNAEDYALWLRVATPARIVRVAEVLAFYHFHDGEQASNDYVNAAMQHLRVQQEYLASHPQLADILGTSRIRELTIGRLLKRGYACYWKRDLTAARQIFRAVMKQGFGSPKDWKYMLPAWLPEAWHRKVIELIGSK